MAKYHDVLQRSDEWDRLRCGIITASNFSKIITPTGKPSKQWEDMAFDVIAEKMLGRKTDTYTAPAMERGSYLENDACDWYENIHCDGKVALKKMGFITTDDGLIGCSPDRLIGDDGILEIKIPLPKTQVRYLIKGELQEDYTPQIQGQLYVSGRKYVDIVAWHPELSRTVITVERNEAFIACLDQLLKDFNHYVSECWAKIKEVSDVPEIKNSQTLLGG
jgi:hypothetical protein